MRFFGYGLIFSGLSALTIVIAAGVMLAVNVDLALVSLAPMPLVIWVARAGAVTGRRRRRCSSGSRSSPRRPRIQVRHPRVKALPREQRQLARFNHAVRRVFDQSMVSARLRARSTAR